MTRTTITEVAGYTTPTYGFLLDNDTVQTLIDMVNEHASALDTAGVPPGTLGTETKSSGALTLTHQLSYLSVTNTVAFTLADGTVAGQVKQIECSAVSGTPVGTLTVTTMDTAGGGASATFVFHAVGQRIELEWSGTAWHLTKLVSAGRKTVTVGTTDLAGYVLTRSFDLSIDGTKHSTSTLGVPNGRFPGQSLHLDVTSATNTPNGDINITARTQAGAAATSYASIGGTDTFLDVQWDGSAWQAIQFTAGATATATLS